LIQEQLKTQTPPNVFPVAIMVHGEILPPRAVSQGASGIKKDFFCDKKRIGGTSPESISPFPTLEDDQDLLNREFDIRHASLHSPCDCSPHPLCALVISPPFISEVYSLPRTLAKSVNPKTPHLLKEGTIRLRPKRETPRHQQPELGWFKHAQSPRRATSNDPARIFIRRLKTA
jgi:hypothetical protein